MSKSASQAADARAAAIVAASTWFDGGALLEELRQRVAIRTDRRAARTVIDNPLTPSAAVREGGFSK